jgi:hypothetical protein
LNWDRLVVVVFDELACDFWLLMMTPRMSVSEVTRYLSCLSLSLSLSLSLRLHVQKTLSPTESPPQCKPGTATLEERLQWSVADGVDEKTSHQKSKRGSDQVSKCTHHKLPHRPQHHYVACQISKDQRKSHEGLFVLLLRHVYDATSTTTTNKRMCSGVPLYAT